MLRNTGGRSLLRGSLGVQVVGDNHTIDDTLWSQGWDASKRVQNGQGPISVQTYASRTRRRLLTDMQHLQTQSGGSGVARNGHENTTRPHTVVTCGHGACRDALEAVPWVLGQMRGCTPVKLVQNHVNSHEICTKFVQISTKFVRILYEFT